MDQQEPEELSLVKNKRMNQKCGQKKMVFGGPKENEARKTSAFQKVMKAFGEVGFALPHLERVQAVIFINTKARGKGKDQKGKRQGRCPSADRILSF